MPRLYFHVASSRFHTDKRTGEEPRVLGLAWWRDDQEHPVFRMIHPLTDTTDDPASLARHGISVELAKRDGVPAAGVVTELNRAAHGVTTIASFFQDFHWRNLHRLMGHAGAAVPPSAVCVMKAAEPILCIPAMRPGGGFKFPSLVECCQYFGIEPPLTEGPPAHIAMSTVRAVRGVYEACVREHSVPR